MKKLLFSIVILLVVFYLVICLLLFLMQEQFIFFPTKLPQDYVFNYPNATEVFLPIKDNQHIHGLYFSNNEQPKGVVLYFHGNAGALDSWGNVANNFLPLGYDALVMDYRTFGKSQGKLSEQNLYDDAQLAYDYLLKKFKAENIVIYGRSIGTGVASNLASNNMCKTLILETPYYDLYDVVKNHFKAIPKKGLMRYHFKNNEHLAKVKVPVYIFHGTRDDVISIESGLKLKPLMDEDNFIIVPNANHNNIGQFAIYHEKLSEILE